jgi:hypothetical protein
MPTTCSALAKRQIDNLADMALGAAVLAHHPANATF